MSTDKKSPFVEELTEDFEKQDYELSFENSSSNENNHLAFQEGRKLKKDLKSRHITMIAIGGALGTGLVIGTSNALYTAGPGSVLICYSLVGGIVYFVMSALGEMASFIPLPEGFAGYASRYCDDSLGFAVGICYLCKYLIVAPNQLVASAMVMQFWVSGDKVNPGVWVAIFGVTCVCLNFLGVKFFGEFEFWLSSLKVLTILGLIILMLVIMLGGGPTHDRLGFRYWTNPGAFAPYHGIENQSLAKFVAFWSVMVNAVFAYLGTELVAITFSEAKNPRKSIKKAIKLTFYRILFFYVLSVFLLGCCVAYNNPELVAAQTAKSGANASAFVVAISNAKINGLDHLINACILIFIISAFNSDLYIGTRNAYGLAANGQFPKIFTKTNKQGVPYIALIFCACFSCLAFMVCSSESNKVFNYFVNVVSIFGLLTWISILITYIFFHRAIISQGYDRNTLTYKSPFQPYGSYFALFMCILVSLTKNFTVFINGFNYKSFITGYIGIPVYLIAYFGHKFFKKTKIIKPEEADLVTYKDAVDDEEQMYLKLEANQPQLTFRDPKWWYENTLGVFF